MVSFKSIQMCFAVNTIVLGFAAAHYAFLESVQYNLTLTILSIYLKNYMIVESLHGILQKRPYIFYKDIPRLQKFSIKHFVSTYGVEALSFLLCLTMSAPSTSPFTEYALFIPRSFIFELIFDFFHYWTHRFGHSHPLIYNYIHKGHHNGPLINAYDTFQHTLPDIILTNALPILLTMYLFPLSRFTLTLLFWFKTIVEVSGHTGKDTTSSFIQFIYLPQWLGIDIYTRDHGLHHYNPRVNFSKRFSIWDKVFGSFKSGTTLRNLE